MESAKPSFIAIPVPTKPRELISLHTISPLSTSPTNSRSGANTPSFNRSCAAPSSKAVVASSPATPQPSAPPLQAGASDFPTRKLTDRERTSYFAPSAPGLLFSKQPFVSHEPVLAERQLSTAERWNITLERVIKGIVSIKATTLRSFDTESAGSYTATGFVVDRSRGLILSNRHVVNPSPTTSTAVLGNYEEVPLEPIYYDPVHDFGFFKYDPTKIKFADIEEIELCPQAAKVGLDIKVCGNDAGEKLSILGSTLARLDRAAPYYGDESYNDFNTFYFQAASGTSGGSSGSPVLDIHGRAVALNAGGSRKSASSFYLPLDRVVRALKLIQEGKSVPRGTLQTEFIHSSYDELKRLGLPQDVERECRERFPDGTGMLSISALLPQGPGSVAGLEVGDILVECYQLAFGRRDINNFYSLWEVIDESVDNEVELTIYRGKERKVVSVMVQDLHSITPNKFLEIGEAVIHPLSYQLARSHHLPCKGIFVATSGMFNWSNTTRNFLVTQLDGNIIDSLETFTEVVLSIKDGKRVGFRYLNLGGWEEEFGIVEIDHHFFPTVLFTRSWGSWERKVLAPKAVEDSVDSKKPVTAEAIEESWTEKMRKSIVMIQCRLPFSINGFTSASPYSGVGILVATDPVPMIITSRATVPVSVCDLRITVGDRNIRGRVLYIGLVVVITVDPQFLPRNIPIFVGSTRSCKVGDELELFALDDEHQLVQKRSQVSAINGIVTRQCSPPRWRISNTEGISLQDCPYTNGGVLLDPTEKSMVALWMTVGSQNSAGKNTTWKTGLNYEFYIRPIIDALQRGEELQNRCCGWEFEHMQLATAMNLGLDEIRATNLATIAKGIGAVPRPIFVSGKLLPPTSVEDDFKIGDVILEVNGNAVGRMADVRTLSHLELAKVLVLRNGKEKEITVRSQLLPSHHTSRIVCWAGAVVHQTHNSVLEQTTPEFVRVSKREGITNPDNAVYISSIMYGSPAIGNLRPVQWILEVDGRKVRTLDDLVEIISTLKERDESEEYVRVRLMGRKGITSVVSVRLDSKFWPSWELDNRDGYWVRSELE